MFKILFSIQKSFYPSGSVFELPGKFRISMLLVVSWLYFILHTRWRNSVTKCHSEVIIDFLKRNI